MNHDPYSWATPWQPDPDRLERTRRGVAECRRVLEEAAANRPPVADRPMTAEEKRMHWVRTEGRRHRQEELLREGKTKRMLTEAEMRSAVRRRRS